MAVTKQQREILRHMTGLDRSETPNRKHFAASPGSDDFRVLEGMVPLGLVTCAGSRPGIFGDLVFYYTTDAGVAAAQTRA